MKEYDIFWTGVTSKILRQSGIMGVNETCPMRKQIDPGYVNTTPKPTVTTKEDSEEQDKDNDKSGSEKGPRLFMATILCTIFLWMS